MVNTENMAKWAEALESGEYEQGRNRLATLDVNDQGEESGKTFYCCLGVACEVAIKNGVELVKARRHNDDSPVLSYDGESAVLPRKVREWLGLTGEECVASGNPQFNEGSAVELNDEEGLNFVEIAGHVRTTFLEA